MNEIFSLALAVVTGILLGVIFFGGLWWTVQNSLGSKRPQLWFLGSFLLRTAITLLGFYFIGNGQWKRIMVCLLGFIIARIIVKRVTGSRDSEQSHSVRGGQL